jgi:hypothetical protein
MQGATTSLCSAGARNLVNRHLVGGAHSATRFASASLVSKIILKNQRRKNPAGTRRIGHNYHDFATPLPS